MRNRFTIPKWVKKHYSEIDNNIDTIPKKKINEIRIRLKQLNPENPEVSIVIPAYNEEKELLKTLSSLSHLVPNQPTELIIVNNNSSDRTQEILNICGVKSIFEKKQGATYARQAGLDAAKGKYILSADADSIYPPDWGNAYIRTLKEKENVAIVYGRYSFIPSKGSNRLFLGVHEIGAEMMFKRRKEEELCVNVVGFNNAFRKTQALLIGGYNHKLFFYTNQRGEDGWLAKNLSQKFGTITFVPTKHRVWTSDRRLLQEGSLIKATSSRVKRYIKVALSQ